MPRNVLLQVRRGLEANIGTLADGELGFCTDTQKLYIGSAGGNVLLVAAQTAGDMLKSVYDTNNNGKVDNADAADSVPWAGVSGKPSTYPPSAHNHDDRYPRTTITLGNGVDLNTVVTSGFYRLSGAPLNAPTGADWSQLIVSRGADTIAQLVISYSTKKTHVRTGNPTNVGGAGSWGSWDEIAYASNVMPKGPLTWAQLRGGA